MISTSGYSLIDDPAVSALIEYIIPQSTYITPNYDELKALCGKDIKEIKLAGHDLLQRFTDLKGVVLKGGHIDTQSHLVTDIFLLREQNSIAEIVETNPRHHTKNTHGTGCTFASAFAAFLAKKNEPAKAFSKAIASTNRLIDISKEINIGQGNGPLLHHKEHSAK